MGNTLSFCGRLRKRKANPSAHRLAAPAPFPEGSAQRSPERGHDRVLTAVAWRWLTALPTAVRPRALSDQYPRVANRLALCWSDPQLVKRVFDDLLLSTRGNRQGFPPAVAAELLRLRDLRKLEERVDPWRAQATADR